MTLTSEWEAIISEVMSAPAVAMVVGATDTGKTTFCAQLCNAAAEAGVPAAVVDADVGQSEIGAPGTIGMALVDKPIEAIADLKPRRLYFIGSTTPAQHLLQCAVGAKKMVDAALELGAKLVVLDTTGLVGGAIGRSLKTYKADLVRPGYLIGIQKRHEIEHLLAPFGKIEWVKIRRAASPETARPKPAEVRATRRQINFHRHFNDALGHIIRMDEICTWNTWLGTGRPMKWQYMKFMEDALSCRILHAEVTGRGVFAVSEKPCSKLGYRELEEQFGTKAITIITGDALRNLLVGLADANGATLNVGLIQAIDFKQRFIFVLSPIKTISPVRVVQFGSMRVTKEGKELGMLSLGEL